MTTTAMTTHDFPKGQGLTCAYTFDSLVPIQVFVSLVPTKSKIWAQLYLQGWGGVGWG